MIKPVLKMGHPLLRQPAAPVTPQEMEDGTLQNLIRDLFDTMAQEEGIGIAAPQIGVSKQVAIVGLPDEKNSRYQEISEEGAFTPLVVVNPTITVLDSTPQGYWEGCLSVPGLRGYVERPQKIKVNFTDPQGKSMEAIAEGFLATVFQHELDHLEGVLYVDRVSDNKLVFNEEYEQYHCSE